MVKRIIFALLAEMFFAVACIIAYLDTECGVDEKTVGIKALIMTLTANMILFCCL